MRRRKYNVGRMLVTNNPRRRRRRRRKRRMRRINVGRVHVLKHPPAVLSTRCRLDGGSTSRSRWMRTEAGTSALSAGLFCAGVYDFTVQEGH